MKIFCCNIGFLVVIKVGAGNILVGTDDFTVVDPFFIVPEILFTTIFYIVLYKIKLK